MKKIIREDSTHVELTPDEAKSVCRLGQGERCCAFLSFMHTAGEGSNFTCVRMVWQISMTIFNRLDAGTMKAKGRGGWPGCAWEGHGS